MKSLLILLLGACASASGPVDSPHTESVQQGVYTTPWSMTRVFPGDALHLGADGVDFGMWGGVASVATPFEQSGKVGVADLTGTTLVTLNAGSGSGPEDVRFCDLDKDGVQDLVVANSGSSRVSVIYGGTTTAVTITASQGHARWIQVGCGDFNGDGVQDIVGGSYAGTTSTPAVIAVLYGSGSRLGTSWTFEQVTPAGWAMSVIPVDFDKDGDLDILVTDRAAIAGPNYSYMGTRWEEHVTTVPTGWVNHTILGAPYAGDQMFGLVVDFDKDGTLDVLSTRSHAGQPNYIDIWLGPSYTSRTTITDPNSLDGHVQGVAVADINKDGMNDIVVSSWESNTCCDSVHSGVWWFDEAATWEREEISGGGGTKFDNIVVDANGDVWDSEQVDNYGIVKYTNPF